MPRKFVVQVVDDVASCRNVVDVEIGLRYLRGMAKGRRNDEVEVGEGVHGVLAGISERPNLLAILRILAELSALHMSATT